MNASALRLYYLIATIALIALGCAPSVGKPAEDAPATNSTPDQTYTSLMVGIWQFSFPDGEQNVRIEMRSDGHWELWSPSRQVNPNSTNSVQGGTWFVRNRTLLLRIEHVALGHMSPGLAYTFDFVSVSPDTAVFTWLDGKREVRWRRVRQNPSDAQDNWAREPLPPGSNLQERLEELARRRGVPLNVLTQQLATELSNAFSQALSGPIDFYGKAVDESEAPLGGASATVRCLIFPENQFTTNILTDANGLFSLHGIQGQALFVSVAKEGCEEVPGTNEHHFAYYGVAKGFQPNPHNPVVFLLRKKTPEQK